MHKDPIQDYVQMRCYLPWAHAGQHRFEFRAGGKWIREEAASRLPDEAVPSIGKIL
jgi:hypothetical protein